MRVVLSRRAMIFHQILRRILNFCSGCKMKNWTRTLNNKDPQNQSDTIAGLMANKLKTEINDSKNQ